MEAASASKENPSKMGWAVGSLMIRGTAFDARGVNVSTFKRLSKFFLFYIASSWGRELILTYHPGLLGELLGIALEEC